MEKISELTISGDGTWHKRGYTSSYSVFSIIGYYIGKVVDIVIESSYYKMNIGKLKKILQDTKNSAKHTKIHVLRTIKDLQAR